MKIKNAAVADKNACKARSRQILSFMHFLKIVPAIFDFLKYNAITNVSKAYHYSVSMQECI
jgi:hypothetical protein